MSQRPEPYFKVGEVCILQPPHPSARHLWGKETTVKEVTWRQHRNNDAMGLKEPGYNYETDIPAPPPSNSPEDQLINWVWCEYDLRKKYDPGDSFEDILEATNDLLIKVNS